MTNTATTPIATPIMVRNLEAGPTVFVDHRNDLQVEWQGAGDLGGMDLQQVPPEIVGANVAFIRAVNRGIFQVEEAPEEIREALDRQKSSWQARQEQARRSTESVMDELAGKDILSLPCVGPKGHSGGLCGDPVPVREAARDERPPLCPRHRSLEGQFILTEDETKPVRDGISPKRWVRAVTEARTRQAR